MARELPIFDPNPAHAHATRRGRSRSPWAAARRWCRRPPPIGTRPLRRHPDWIKSRMPSGDNYHDLKGLLRGLNLNTVCEEAVCPNIGECWDQRTATVMILGDVCTRACGFCAIKTGRPTWFDDDEPRRVAEAVSGDAPGPRRGDQRRPRRPARRRRRRLRRHDPRDPRPAARCMGVEVLIPDFNGEEAPLRTVMEAGPGHPQPQPRDREAAPEARPQARPLGPDAGRAGAGEGLRRRVRQRGPHEEQPHGRPGRDPRGADGVLRRRSARSTATSSRSASTCARRPTTCPSSATTTPTSSRR